MKKRIFVMFLAVLMGSQPVLPVLAESMEEVTEESSSLAPERVEEENETERERTLEEQTMNMAKAAAKLFEENIRYSNGEPVKVVIADTTIGRVPESAACAEKFRKEGVDITLTVTPCWCYGQPTSLPRTTGISFARAALAQAMIPSKTTFPLYCSTSVALVMERSNKA